MRRRLFIVVTGVLLAFPVAAGNYTVPFETNRCRLITVEVRVNGKPATFIFDTGATLTAVDAKLLHIPFTSLDKARLRAGEPGLFGLGGTRKVNFHLGQYRLRDFPVRVLDLSRVQQLCVAQADGILGQDVLRQFKEVTIDYERKEVRLTR